MGAPRLPRLLALCLLLLGAAAPAGEQQHGQLKKLQDGIEGLELHLKSLSKHASLQSLIRPSGHVSRHGVWRTRCSSTAGSLPPAPAAPADDQPESTVSVSAESMAYAACSFDNAVITGVVDPLFGVPGSCNASDSYR